MKIILEHGQNVDLMWEQGNGSGYHEEPDDPEYLEVTVNDLKEASTVYRTWINSNGLGMGNITAESGKVMDKHECIARVSYNGRVWTPHPYGHPDWKEIPI